MVLNSAPSGIKFYARDMKSGILDLTLK